MWHVSSRSGVATLRTAIHLLLTYRICRETWRWSAAGVGTTHSSADRRYDNRANHRRRPHRQDYITLPLQHAVLLSKGLGLGLGSCGLNLRSAVYPLSLIMTLCPTTSAPWLILSSSENCLNHSILVKLLILVDFCVSLCALASGWLL